MTKPKEDMRPLVSVIIPTHNRARLLTEALDSVYAQEGQRDLFDLEVVVVDDASTDDTPAIVARYPARYIRHPVNRGTGGVNRNTGIEASRGEYVAFLDDDDIWLPHKLRIQVPLLQSNPAAGLAFSSFIAVLDNKDTDLWSQDAPSGYVFEKLLAHNFIGCLTVVVRRTALSKTGYFAEDVPGIEDYDLWLRLAYHFPFIFVPTALAVYRFSNQGQLMRAVANGTLRLLHRRVMERALSMIPYTSKRSVQRAIDQMELANFSRLEWLPDNAKETQMLAHLREYPRIARNAHVRYAIVSLVRHKASTSDFDLEAARSFCEALMSSAAGTFWGRRLLGEAWMTGVAKGLLFRGERRLAVRAACEALRYDPILLARKGLVWSLRLMRRASAVIRG
jgi:glycosyltransferase involved in cell wall biosynthesis